MKPLESFSGEITKLKYKNHRLVLVHQSLSEKNRYFGFYYAKARKKTDYSLKYYQIFEDEYNKCFFWKMMSTGILSGTTGKGYFQKFVEEKDFKTAKKNAKKFLNEIKNYERKRAAKKI